MENIERNKTIARAVLGGCTMSSVANEHNLTPSGIRATVAKTCLQAAPQLYHLVSGGRFQFNLKRMREFKDAFLLAIEAWDGNPPMDLLLKQIMGELWRAERVFKPFNSPHEGYAVILEELDELWDEIKDQHKTPGRTKRMRAEAKQVAAMAIRFIKDCCRREVSDETE